MLTEIGGLWVKHNKNGEEYYTGRLGNSNLILFKNKNKKTDKEPEFRLYVGSRQNNYNNGSKPTDSDSDTEE